METKQVIVMRKDLNMRKGKMIAQGAHASLKVILDMTRPVYGVFSDKLGDNYVYELKLPSGPTGDQINDWLKGIFTKICVGVDSEEELLTVVAEAKHLKLPCALILDSGLTEFDRPTYTCCAIGPASNNRIDQVTGRLKLL